MWSSNHLHATHVDDILSTALKLWTRVSLIKLLGQKMTLLKAYKNSSVDEIANVNFLRRYRTYFEILKRESASFNKLDDT